MAVDERSEGLIDTLALGAWMDAHGLPGAGEPMSVRFLAGGASNEIFAIERGGERMALRRPPRMVPKGRNETMLREFRVLSALKDSDVPHARALGVCEDTSIIGATFYLMQYVDGWSPINLEDRRWPTPFDVDLDARRGLAYELVDAIAKLGQVDWRAVGLEGFGKPEGFLDRQVDRWLAHLLKFEFRELPGLMRAADWLRSHTPKHFTPGIIHGDYQFANVMFHHGAPARLAAVVDWEMATIGDPLLDLAWVLMTWPDEDERTDESATKTYVDYAGMPNRRELMHRYSTLSGLPVDAMDYYIVLGRFKMAIVLEQGYARYMKGGADNPKMQAFGEVVLDMAARADALAQTSPL